MSDKLPYDIKWFENNMRPVIAPGLGCCSACCLRNLDKQIFCNKLQCYDDLYGDFVYWKAKKSGENYDLLTGLISKQMLVWFNKTPIEQSQKISGNIIRQTIQNNRQK